MKDKDELDDSQSFVIKVDVGKKEESLFNDPTKLRRQLPGNNMLSEEEDKKYGSRKNRYGLYGDNGYGEAIEI